MSDNRVESRLARPSVRLVGATLVATFVGGGVATGQPVANIDFKSVGRAAPLAVTIPTPANPDIEAYPPAQIAGLPERYWMVGPFLVARRGPDGKPVQDRGGSAWNGATPKGVQPLARRSLHVHGFLPGPRAVERPALFPLQQQHRSRGAMDVARRGARHDRRSSARLRCVGLLRPRSSTRSARKPVRVQDGRGALRGVARGDAPARRPHRAHVRHRARRHRRPLRLATRPELVRRAVLDTDPHRAVAADAGISNTNGRGDVSRRSHERAAVAGPILLARRVHASLALSRRHEPAALDHRHAKARADPRGRCRQLHHAHQHRSHVRYQGCRAASRRRRRRRGTARRSGSGTRTR